MDKIIISFLISMVIDVSIVQMADHCGLNTRFGPPQEDKIFSFTSRKEKLSSSHERSRDSCLGKCCNTDTCNIASFNESSSKRRDKNCFLYVCLTPTECNFKEEIGVISYALLTDDGELDNSTPLPDTDDSETIKQEVDVHDGPPEEQEIISERIVDVINDTDADLDLSNNVTNTEGSASSFPSTLSSAQTTNTLNSSPSSTSSKSTSGTSDISTTNLQATLSNTVTHNSSSSSKMASTLQSPTNTLTQSSDSSNASTLSLPKTQSTVTSVHTLTTEVSNTTSEDITKPTTEETLQSVTVSEQPHNVSQPPGKQNTTMASITESPTNTITTKKAEVTKQLNSSVTPTTTTKIPTTASPPTKTTTSTTTTTTTTTIQPANTTAESTVQQQTDTTTEKQDTTVITQHNIETTTADHTDWSNSSTSQDTNKPHVTTARKDNIEHMLLLNLKNQTIHPEVLYTPDNGQDIILVTPNSVSADLIIPTFQNRTMNETVAKTTQQNRSVKIDVLSEVSHQIEAPEITVLNNTIYLGDLNITFADSNRLLEEAKDSHVLSAALIAALSFGILFFFAVLVLIGKRCFDSWQRRHYSRVDYLVNGMYN